MRPDLSGGVEADGLGLSYGDHPPRPYPSLPGHHFGDALRYRIDHPGLGRDLHGNEGSWRQASFFERRRPFEQNVVRVEVLDEDDVARNKVASTDQTVRDRGAPEATGRRQDQKHNNEGSDAKFPRRPDRLVRVEEVSPPCPHPARSRPRRAFAVRRSWLPAVGYSFTVEHR